MCLNETQSIKQGELTQINVLHAFLQRSQSLHIGHFIQVPHFDGSVLGAAEELVRVTSEHQTLQGTR